MGPLEKAPVKSELSYQLRCHIVPYPLDRSQKMTRLNTLGFALAFDPSSYSSGDVVKVDVAVIGGGATGTYAGISLSDMGHSVVVVEKLGLLGGHTNTYVDAGTGIAIDYGVQRYQNEANTLDFFSRLNVTPSDDFPVSAYNTTIYADFSSSKVLDFTPGTNFTGWLEQCYKYPWMQYTSDIPPPVPEDLYLSMDKFITKYDLGDISCSTNRIVGGNDKIYESALDVLGSSVLLNSTVIAAKRGSTADEATYLVVSTPTGLKLIQASRLLITIPTTKTNMAPFAPDTKEEQVFTDFEVSGYYTGLVRFSEAVLPAATAYENADPNAEYYLPQPPALISFAPTAVENLYTYRAYSTNVLSDSDAQTETLDLINTFVTGLTGKTADIELAAFNSHSPFRPSLTSEAIKGGYWGKMYGLQGYRNTWYTGAQFLPGSSQLWNYTATLLPDIVANL
ncbi:hypothetical protein M406DRAFT_59906 [Cryphonectria parasitica EP155]|uniref:Uncharacterized protein n=1 Tax=Cryphonectria parasitica (strain ATCC 38755 / EP155) TaxID=660469 RepID=A0A9P5CU90_CRYP1|nr:uncharacterized protein M406DRAFT_59906 [Cryphonectria parasitica EP155]KAF3771153.1 hypothetical protein M406DRAFT_59906 [Cryphonectria parasitica EP155]